MLCWVTPGEFFFCSGPELPGPGGVSKVSDDLLSTSPAKVQHPPNSTITIGFLIKGLKKNNAAWD